MGIPIPGRNLSYHCRSVEETKLERGVDGKRFYLKRVSCTYGKAKKIKPENITCMKFLVVDDEKDVEILFRQKFRKEIRKREVEFEFAFSGEEALKILGSKSPPEVVYIFSDINMPGMSGIELLRHVKREYPSIKVSMISAYGDNENYNKAITSGAKEFFTKPIDFISLKKEIEQLIHQEKKNSQ